MFGFGNKREGDLLREKHSKRLEKQFLGRIDTENIEYNKALAKIKKPSTKKEFSYYVAREDALDLVREFQPFDPENPDTELLRELRLAVQEKLEEYFGEFDDEDIKVFTAVDTPADFLHGIDAFLDIGNQTVTLDLTIRKEKDMVKSDVLIKLKEMPDLKDPAQEEAFLEEINSVAKEIFKKLDKESLKELVKRAA